jgi:hypothetical protein
VKNEKYKREWRLKVKIHILFYGDNSCTVALRQMKFGTLRDHGHTNKFYMTFFVEDFKYGDIAKF